MSRWRCKLLILIACSTLPVGGSESDACVRFKSLKVTSRFPSVPLRSTLDSEWCESSGTRRRCGRTESERRGATGGRDTTMQNRRLKLLIHLNGKVWTPFNCKSGFRRYDLSVSNSCRRSTPSPYLDGRIQSRRCRRIDSFGIPHCSFPSLRSPLVPRCDSSSVSGPEPSTSSGVRGDSDSDSDAGTGQSQ